MKPWRLLAVAAMLALVAGCSEKKAETATLGDADLEPPMWHFEPIDHRQGDMTLTDVWGRSDGAVFVVGWYGTIFSNRVTAANPEGLWTRMASGTNEHLTAIWGVENGGRFRQRGVDGEMFAVGWHGTILHYHPNPDAKPTPVPEDGVWQLVSGPGHELVPKTKVDPYCPDFDGDGIADDGGGAPTGGGGDGWWSPDQTCRSGTAASCDDNCRSTANGPQRPIRDVGGGTGGLPDGCLNPADGDGPYPASGATTRNQVDADGDGIGRDCDDDDQAASTPAPFRPALLDVWASAQNGQLVVVAVGEQGALITYAGADAAPATPAPTTVVTDPAAWFAQDGLSYRFDNDCSGATPVGTVCGGSGRLPPSCPAQCHPYRTNCDCPVDQGQCCDAGAPTGCENNSCTPVVNACGTPTAGSCSAICPGCFRRLDTTLRSVTSDGTNVIAVGAAGTVVKLSIDPATPATLLATWTRPDCTPMPKPLDERPVLTRVAMAGSVAHVVGAAGVFARVDASAASCGLTTLDASCGAPQAFMADIFPLSGSRAYAIGDAGVFIIINGQLGSACTPNRTPVELVATDLLQNLNGLWVTRVQGTERVWFVGATGVLVRAGYY
ncbi:MAG: hypothetical protein HY903_12420 [Deltaproteobacteria bacterium]|nr:hypothetical protein [Deltaproteobacteria bacterium]